MNAIEFPAPWSRSLKVSTCIATVFFAAIAIVGLIGKSSDPRWLLLIIVPPIPVIIAFIFSVRGYVLSDSEIEIRRVGFVTRLPLAGLQGVEGNTDALKSAFRLFANGGLFAYVGFYWSAKLKIFRVYATDADRAVILRYARKRIVISPHDPQRFIVRARTLLQIAQFPE